jgi:beta-aspartyl-peptidase (threonine type)
MASRSITTWGPLRLGKPAVIVHGGAGGWKGLHSFDEVKAAVERGAAEGYSAGGSALNAAVEAIKALEDSGVLNAGIGSVLTADGRVEMDAGIMDSSLRAGGVAAVTYPRNPIVLAKWVMLNTPHVIIAGSAADRIAEKLGLPRHPGPSSKALERWRNILERIRRGEEVPERIRRVYTLYYGGDTVGAVAVGAGGDIAAGASTGGIVFKHPGRVGDSPIPGAGFYVVKDVGGCSATGIGETIILGRPCLYALQLLEEGVPVEEAARAAVARHTRLFGEDNLGIILLDAEGNAAAAMNTEAMPVAARGSIASHAAIMQRSGAER